MTGFLTIKKSRGIMSERDDLERNTLHRLWAISESEKPWKKHKPQSVGHNKRQEWPWNIACLVFSPQE